MCKAWADHRNSGKAEGMIEGKAEGKAEGKDIINSNFPH